MVDFLDRDDQQMIEFTERMLTSAARHHLHIQIHGLSKNSGEQRAFPHLFNHEGVLKLEYVKWSRLCAPDHNVNVAFTRALAGAVDYHLGVEFIRDVPTTWDETRFVAGEPGEYIVLARRRDDVWYLGGITNWTSRDLNVPLSFLNSGTYRVTLYSDGSLDEAHPNDIRQTHQHASASAPLHVSMAPGGGFVSVLTAN
jgi:alpha-glucosidase